jgi:uncharacterized protein (DUF2062 family)
MRPRGSGKFRGAYTALVRRWLRMVLLLWERAKNEHSTPAEIGWSVAVGVFSGCTPFVGFHLWIALALATLLRLNRLWAALGSRVSFTPLLAALTFCEIEVAHRLRVGRWAGLTVHDAIAHAQELFGDWLLGAGTVGGALGAALGFAAYLVARRLAIPRSPAVSLRRSSGSPP